MGTYGRNVAVAVDKFNAANKSNAAEYRAGVQAAMGYVPPPAPLDKGDCPRCTKPFVTLYRYQTKWSPEVLLVCYACFSDLKANPPKPPKYTTKQILGKFL